MAKGDTPNQGSQNSNRPNNMLEGLYKSTVGQTASDYDSIMNQYKNLGSSGQQNPFLNFSPITPTLTNYNPSSEFSKASSVLGNLASTGGLSETDQGNIRARGISPIRSVYANAQQNLNRQRALQGGYSPSYNATSSKMTRELADMISNKTTDVNAQIAQMIQQGKLSAAPGLASLGTSSNNLINQINENNANAVNQANQFNATAPLSFANYNKSIGDTANANKLAGIQGQQSLYGTSPALANTFGSQVMEMLRQQLQAEQSGNQTALQMANMGVRPGTLGGGISRIPQLPDSNIPLRIG